MRTHAVSEAQEKAWRAAGKPTAGQGLDRAVASGPSVWLPGTHQHYAGLLDHGLREVTHGVVMHVNAGWEGRIGGGGTLGYFTNGYAPPIGSGGVGAHFEMGGVGINGVPSSSEYSDCGSWQLLPIDAVAWHAVDANVDRIGVEQAGFGVSTYEWERTHFNVVGDAAYRVAWILHYYKLGPPHISEYNINVGNIWPHSAGGEAWGGHAYCPGSAYPWDMFEVYCNRAYNTKWLYPW